MTALYFATTPLIHRLQKFVATACVITGAAVAASPSMASEAAQWPAGPITFIVPFSPGGGGDTLVRLYGAQLSKTMGTQFIIENKPGAGGNIGTAAAAKATPDGNTIVFGTTGTMGTNHALYKNPGFSIDDFEPVAIFGSTPLALVVGADSRFQSVKDMIDYAKTHPRELTCASGGNGTASHIACVMFQQMAGIEVEHIPYKGTTTAVVDLRSDRISFMIDVTPPIMPHIKDGALRALAVTMDKRIPALPDTPTMNESGVTGYELFTWDGIFAPKGTPAARLDKLHATVEAAISEPGFRKTMTDRGTILESMPRQEFAALVRKEHARMGSVVKSLGVTLD